MAAAVCTSMNIFVAVVMNESHMHVSRWMEVPIIILNHLKKLFEAINSGQRATEKPITIDAPTNRKYYRCLMIWAIVLVRGDGNMAGATSKLKCNAASNEVLSNGIDNPSVVFKK